jgi:hypothetical protein
LNDTQPTPDRIMRLINGYWATGILGAAASHSLFTHLDAGADSAGLLATAAGISERGAQTVLDGLVSLNWSSCATAATATPPRRGLSWSRASLRA